MTRCTQPPRTGVRRLARVTFSQVNGLVDLRVRILTWKFGCVVSPTGLFFGVQGCPLRRASLETPMTRPGRVRRGHPAQHRHIPHRSFDRPAQHPQPDPSASTSPDQTTIDSGGLAGRGVVRQSRRGITRPSHRGSSAELASSPVHSSSTADTMSAEPLLFTAEQAASLLQVRPSWLRRKAAARAVPCRFVGKHLRFSRSDIETIADGNTPNQHSS